MNRRHFISTLGLGSAALGLLAACGKSPDASTSSDDLSSTGASSTGALTTENTADALPEVRWKLVTSWPKNFPGLGQGPENLAKIVAAMTNGRFTIQVLGAGDMVGAMEVFDAVSQGSAQMGHSSAYYWKGKMPAAPFFTTVPFGLTATEMNGWIHYGGGLDLWRELYQPFGVLPFAGGNTGTQMAGWFNKEIHSMADLQGLKMRIPGLAGEVFHAVGGSAVSLPGGELFTALQTGVIDAAEWVGPYNDKAFGLHTIAKYYYYPGWHEPGPMMEFIVHEKTFAALPATYQAILTQAFRAINQDVLDEYTAHNHASLTDLLKDGVQLRKLPDDVLATLHDTSETVVQQIGETSDLAKRIYTSYLAYRNGVRLCQAIGEGAYVAVRDRDVNLSVLNHSS